MEDICARLQDFLHPGVTGNITTRLQYATALLKAAEDWLEDPESSQMSFDHELAGVLRAESWRILLHPLVDKTCPAYDPADEEGTRGRLASARVGRAAVPFTLLQLAEGDACTRFSETVPWWLCACALDLVCRRFVDAPVDITLPDQLLYECDLAVATIPASNMSLRVLMRELASIQRNLRRAAPEMAPPLRAHLDRLFSRAAELTIFSHPAAVLDHPLFCVYQEGGGAVGSGQARAAGTDAEEASMMSTATGAGSRLQTTIAAEAAAAAAAAATSEHTDDVAGAHVTSQFVCECNLLFRSLYARLQVVQMFTPEDPVDAAAADAAGGDRLPLEAALDEKCLAIWLLRMCDSIEVGPVMALFRRQFLLHAVHPGERERCSYVLGVQPSEIDAEDLLHRMRQNDYLLVLRDRGRDLRTILLSKDPNDMLAQDLLCVLLIGRVLEGVYGIRWQEKVVVYEGRIREQVRTLLSPDDTGAYLVQMFSGFRLVQQGRVRVARSTLEAFGQWLHTVVSRPTASQAEKHLLRDIAEAPARHRQDEEREAALAAARARDAEETETAAAAAAAAGGAM